MWIPNACLLAGSFEIELNLLSTVFKIIIIISTDMETMSMSFGEKHEDVSFVPLVVMKINSSVLDECIPRIGQVDNGSMIFLKTLIFLSRLEKVIDIIESCRVVFLRHVNGNNLQTLFPSKQFSREEIYESLFNIFVILEEI